MNATDKTSVQAAFDKAAKELGKARKMKNGEASKYLAEFEANILFAKQNHSHLGPLNEVFKVLKYLCILA